MNNSGSVCVLFSVVFEFLWYILLLLLLLFFVCVWFAQQLPKDCKNMIAMRACGNYIHCIYDHTHFTISLNALNSYIERTRSQPGQSSPSGSSSVSGIQVNQNKSSQKNFQPGSQPGSQPGAAQNNEFITVQTGSPSRINEMENEIELLRYVWMLMFIDLFMV